MQAPRSDVRFEYFAGRLSPAEAGELGAPPGSDFCVTLVTHSDLKELACSAVAAGALAQASGGLLVDPQSGESFSATDAMAWAAQQVCGRRAEVTVWGPTHLLEDSPRCQFVR